MMSYFHHGGYTPLPGMEVGLPAQPIYPAVRIGGSDMPGSFTVQVLHPNGQTINLEIGDLSRPLSRTSSTHSIYAAQPGGPVREGLSRPSSDHMRRRSASVASTSAMEYDSLGVGYHKPGGSHYRRDDKPLIDRIGPISVSDRMSDTSTTLPDLTRSAPAYAPSSSGSFSAEVAGFGGGFANDSFSRPASRMSSRSYNNQPYARPHSSNSYRSSNGSQQSNGLRPRKKDGFYPKYSHDGKTNVGSYPVLPIDRRRPFFTPVPEDPVAGILVKNIAAECTLADVNSTFLDYGRLTCIELVERCPSTIVVYMEYESKDDADMAIQQTHGVVADDSVLETTHVDPNVVHRPNKASKDPALRLTIGNGLLTKKITPFSTTNGRSSDGGKTPLFSMFASRSPTPLPAPLPDASDRSSSVRSKGDVSRNDGRGGPSATVSNLTGSGWDTPEPARRTTAVPGDGWESSIAKQDAGPDSWKGVARREEASDIDLE